MYDTSNFRRGLKIEFKGEPYVITEFQHVKPGKGGAFIRTKLKNLVTGRVLDETFRSGDKVNRPDLEEKEVQYLYQDGDMYHMMDMTTYEDIIFGADVVGDSAGFMQENANIQAMFYNGQPVAIELPIFVELTITETDPGVKGDTASGGAKPATLETGAVVQVPLFLSEGDVIKVDTRTGEYVERAK